MPWNSSVETSSGEEEEEERGLRRRRRSEEVLEGFQKELEGVRRN